MKKYLLTVLICLGMAAVLALGAVSVRPASAAEGDGQELFMPAAIYPASSGESFSAYEQYLDLEDPSDIAVGADYIAIADKPASGNSCIYILRKGTDPQYTRYEHSGTNTLSGLNFYHSAATGKTYLFFFGAIGTVSWLDCDDPADHGTVDTEISPYSMLINGSDVFYTQANDTYSDVYCSSIEEAEGGFSIPTPAQAIETDLSGSTAFSEYNGTVYLANGKQIYACTSGGLAEEYSVTLNNIESFAITARDEKKLVYIGAGNVYIDDTRTITGEYTVVRMYGDFIYIIDGDRIVQYDLSAYSFTDYMIGKYSDYSNRLGAANDISAFGDEVVISDPDNGRVTVYDGEFSQFRTEYPSGLVCAGEEYFLAVSGTVATLYSYDRAQTRTYSLASTAAAAAYSFGTFYIVTADGAHTYAIDTADMTMLHGTPGVTSPKSLAADLQGNLYVLTSNGQVNRYTAEQFLAESATSERLAEFGDGAKDLFVDPLGDLYVLTDNSVFTGSPSASASVDFTETVYGGAGKTAAAFAYEFASGPLYILSDGFVVRADLKESAPASLKNLSSAELRGALSASTPENAADDILVTVPEGSVLLILDDTNLAESNAPSVLSYTGYLRTEEARTGVRICTSEAGTVVAFYRYDEDHSFDVTYPDGTQNTVSATLRDYSLCLVLNEQPAAAGGYEENGYTAYLSNDVGLYRFPLMSLLTERDADNPLQVTENPVTAAQLSKGSRVNVLGTLTMPAADGGWGLDSDAYAFVEYEGQYGFVPESYLIPAGEADLTGETSYIWRNLARGESVTLTNVADPSDSVTLSSRERLCVMTAPDENGMVTVSYAADGKEYRGEIDHALLEHPSSALAIAMMVMIPLVAAAVLLSACYLIFRKQPTLQ